MVVHVFVLLAEPLARRVLLGHARRLQPISRVAEQAGVLAASVATGVGQTAAGGPRGLAAQLAC